MNELIGSLLTFEMATNKNSKKKSVALKANIEYANDKVEEDTHDSLIKSITLLSKRFGKSMRRLNWKSRNNVTTNIKDNIPLNPKGFNSQC